MSLASLPDCLLTKVLKEDTASGRHCVLFSRTCKEMNTRAQKIISETSALRIQKFWRWCRLFASTKVLVYRFKRTGLSREGVMAIRFHCLVISSEHNTLSCIVYTYSSTCIFVYHHVCICNSLVSDRETNSMVSFEQLVEKLRMPAVLNATKKFIHRIRILCLFSQNPRLVRPSTAESLSTREFLDAYMIRYRPEQTFGPENTNALTNKVFKKARSLIAYTDIMMAKIDVKDSLIGNGKTWAMEYPTVIEEYRVSLTTWKARDKESLAPRIRNAIIALMQAQNQRPPDEPEDSQISIELRTQNTRLREQYQRIYGQAALVELDALLAQLNLGPAAEN